MFLKYDISNTLSGSCYKLATCMTGISRHLKMTEVFCYTDTSERKASNFSSPVSIQS